MKNVVVLGATGSGKSSLCNILAGRNSFAVSAGVDSETNRTTIQNARWMGHGEGIIPSPLPHLPHF